MSIEQKNQNILGRFETKAATGTSKVYTGIIDNKKVIMISSNGESEADAILSFKNKFGPERFGGLV
jgi:hypothetical protein